MAITIQTQLSKKIPIAGANYSSQQASITITAEVTDLSQIPTESQRLYAIAEHAVDRQLAGLPITSAIKPVQGGITSPPVSIPQQSNGPQSNSGRTGGQTASPSRPYGGQRRQPAPVTESQLRFLDKLMADSRTSVEAVLEHHRIGSLRELTCRQAGELIDTLIASRNRGVHERRETPARIPTHDHYPIISALEASAAVF